MKNPRNSKTHPADPLNRQTPVRMTVKIVQEAETASGLTQENYINHRRLKSVVNSISGMRFMGLWM
jgi:hypothetical protein